LSPQIFAARAQRVEVFFDQAPAGLSGSRQFGMVKAVYVSRSSTADEAIRRRLVQIGRSVQLEGGQLDTRFRPEALAWG
jgi:hypothetical protein